MNEMRSSTTTTTATNRNYKTKPNQTQKTSNPRGKGY